MWVAAIIFALFLEGWASVHRNDGMPSEELELERPPLFLASLKDRGWILGENLVFFQKKTKFFKKSLQKCFPGHIRRKNVPGIEW